MKGSEDGTGPPPSGRAPAGIEGFEEISGGGIPRRRAPLITEVPIARLAGVERQFQASAQGSPDGAADPGSVIAILLREAREAVSTCEARYRRLVGRVSSLVFELATDGTVLFINEGAALIGCSPDALQGRNLWEAFSEAGGTAAADNLRRRLAAGDVRDYPLVLARGPDTQVFLELTTANRYSNDGQLERIIGFGLDATERARPEGQLRLQGAALNAAANAMLITDREGSILWCNPAFTQLTGYSRAEVAGANPRFLRSGKQDAAFYRGLWETIKSGQVWRGELTNRRKDGSLYPEEMTITPVRGEEGITHFIAVKQDVSARRQQEAARDRLVAIVSAVPHLVATMDARGRFLFLNPAGQRLLEITEDAITEAVLPDVYSTGVRRMITSEALPTAIREGMWSGETTILSRSGREISVQQVILAHRGADGDVEFLSTLAEDIRGRKRLEEEVRHLQKMEAIGRLAGGVAHDFNNFLMPILTYSELLLSKLDSEDPRHHYAQQMARVAERATALPRQLLAFSRRQILEPRVLRLSAIIADMGKMLRRLVGEDIAVEVGCDAELDYVRADVGQIEQVIMNLVVNARDAMPTGGTLAIQAVNVDINGTHTPLRQGITPGHYVRLSVSDTGCGMDGETLSHIFEPFFTTKEAGRGTGLGLSTVYGIVRQSGGAVYADSEPGRGATFTIYLPSLDPAELTCSTVPRTEGTPGGTEHIL
ncbi:MAG: PAS domain S-box protein, partial [Armatimonadetes bacterium]|nr:PAS domain S-box protein [Armatimonadota bacterium]